MHRRGQLSEVGSFMRSTSNASQSPGLKEDGQSMKKSIFIAMTPKNRREKALSLMPQLTSIHAAKTDSSRIISNQRDLNLWSDNRGLITKFMDDSGMRDLTRSSGYFASSQNILGSLPKFQSDSTFFKKYNGSKLSEELQKHKNIAKPFQTLSLQLKKLEMEGAEMIEDLEVSNSDATNTIEMSRKKPENVLGKRV